MYTRIGNGIVSRECVMLWIEYTTRQSHASICASSKAERSIVVVRVQIEGSLPNSTTNNPRKVQWPSVPTSSHLFAGLRDRSSCFSTRYGEELEDHDRGYNSEKGYAVYDDHVPRTQECVLDYGLGA